MAKKMRSKTKRAPAKKGKKQASVKEEDVIQLSS